MLEINMKSIKTLCDIYTLVHYQAKIVTLSGIHIVTLSGDIITFSCSYYIIRRFYYIIRQSLYQQAIVSLSVVTGTLSF